MILIWLQKFLLYGCIGLLIEVFFTGFYSLFQRNWKMTCTTYISMFPVYSLAGIVFEAVRVSINWPFYFKALIYLPLIYGAEAVSGIAIMYATKLLQRLLGGTNGGQIPWQYSGPWAPMGLIDIKKLPFWAIVALAFEPISATMSRVVEFLSK